MTGLEKLIKHIEGDADVAAQSILDQAKREAEDVVAAAKAEAEETRSAIAQQSSIDAQACINRGESAALLQEKRMLLDEKQQLIGDVIAKAKETMLNMSDSQYFDVLLRMIKKYARGQSGQILFSDRDKQRLPVRFEESMRSALSEKDGAKLTVSDETRKIGGGFVLLYGDTEENCSFDALFSAAKESLQDKAGALLFHE